MASKCKNPDCFNYNEDNEVFCEACLEEIVGEMTTEDLYEMFAQGNFNFDQALNDGEAHGILTPNGKRALLKYKSRWFKLINDIMLKKMNMGI